MKKHRFNESYKWIYKTHKDIMNDFMQYGIRFCSALIKLALYGPNHPLYKMWVCKCVYILEYIGRLKMKSGKKVIERHYQEFFTGYNETERETKKWLESMQKRTKYGNFTMSDETVKRVFAIYDSVRISAVSYLMDCNERYFASEYASLIEQAVDGGVKKQYTIDYYKKYMDLYY